MELSIVIPAYNEQGRLGHTLMHIQHGVAQLFDAGLHLRELVVVDDGSIDHTVRIAREWSQKLPITVISLPQNRGKGAAVRTGMLRATGELVLFYDADGATPIGEVVKLFTALQSQQADIAIGSRVLQGREAMVTMSLHRRIIGRLYHFLCSRLVPGIRDTACGCKLFRASAAKRIFELQHIDRFAFDVEVLTIAFDRRYRIVEVPVRWTEIPRSKVRIVRDGLQMFWCVFRLYLQRLFRSVQ